MTYRRKYLVDKSLHLLRVHFSGCGYLQLNRIPAGPFAWNLMHELHQVANQLY